MSENKYEHLSYEKTQKLTQEERVALAESYRKRAEQGDAEAQHCLAYCYSYGVGVRSDEAKSVELYRLAADKGYPPAQYELGSIYFDNYGYPEDLKKEDLEKAFRLIKLAADQAYPPALILVGNCYRNGCGVRKNIIEAAKYYKFAENKGGNEAAWSAWHLKQLYPNLPKDFQKKVFIQNPEKIGIGLDKENKIVPAEYGIDQNLVFEYQKAADLGNAEAQFKFAVCSENGIGVDEPDAAIALYYYKLAAEQKYEPAQLRLALCHQNGELQVEKNPQKAARYFNQSCDEILEKTETQSYGVFRFFSEPQKPRMLYSFQNDLTTNTKLTAEKPSIQEHYSWFHDGNCL